MAAGKTHRKRKMKPALKAKPAVNQQQATSKEDERDNEGPADYGGMPARDLKKNLGCG
jgi:hypothetical protein